jgi:hypothetical protein
VRCDVIPGRRPRVSSASAAGRRQGKGPASQKADPRFSRDAQLQARDDHSRRPSSATVGHNGFNHDPGDFQAIISSQTREARPTVKLSDTLTARHDTFVSNHIWFGEESWAFPRKWNLPSVSPRVIRPETGRPRPRSDSTSRGSCGAIACKRDHLGFPRWWPQRKAYPARRTELGRCSNGRVILVRRDVAGGTGFSQNAATPRRRRLRTPRGFAPCRAQSARA